MSFREVLNALLVPSGHSAHTLRAAEKALINQDGSLCSLGSIKQKDPLEKLVDCTNTNFITEGLHEDAYNEINNFFDFTTHETNYDIFSNFFNQAELAGLELLDDDKRYLRSFGYSRINKELLNQYSKCWLDAMSNEQKSFRKQNKGRYAANTFIREALENFSN